MKLPGPDHPITTVDNPGRVRALAGAHVIADTRGAVTLSEAGYRPVHYLPRQDVEMSLLTQTDLVTHCPYKGDATHYSIRIDGELIEKAAWSYEDPYPAMEAIRGRIAFYRDRIEVEEGEE